ncbi:DUF1918 domain-containing protein [Streptomyces hainanensis]|uniref:DUF1918 domain-containing protein n=1 Tax=Streptomyces hainanensis TaxID=402648 RepID=A0A4R4TLH0_9ACTN|nr:DUF1918 domain-containing protein [Streptomyces hainanensis]TDC75983.1 DUF1918 domain-containing protein [Streptomyces hainanensis]
MRAKTGDRMITHGRTVGDVERVTEVIEVLGENGQPPFRVRSADGHESVVSPGPDSEIRGARRRRFLGRG